MKNLKLILFVLLSNIGYNQYFPYIGPDQTLSNKQESITLTANLDQCDINNPYETTDYELTEIPYIEQTNNGTIISTSGHDACFGPYDIGFNFCFYGQTYDKFYAGVNGIVSFSPYDVQYTFPQYSLPSTSPYTIKNCIFPAWTDWNLNFGGQIKYELQGTAPFRRLVISWVNIAMDWCTMYNGTFHVILYETTNIIETHIKHKPNCSSWVEYTTEGIHNQDGTKGVTVPGRDHAVYVTNNSSHRWTPSGNEILPDLVWYEVGNLNPLGTGNSITITPPLQGASYTCHLEYPSCFSNWSNLTCLGPDTISINYEFEDNTVLIPYIIEHPPIDSLIETPEQPTIGSICYIPNSFTPDGNEFNNIFKPVFNDVDLQYFNFTIYDRWGKIIYKSYDHFSYWDGTYNNTLCPIGIYLYEINFKINDKFYLIHGHVNLIK
jgi:gliding motility-associated-like protein